ncbi:F-actin-capping protein subunit alpha [Choiromyces venosus 120613-1]|uniref:F-actin-capping protein subunit alpha n=1 Tax=Choiromyces venosus 120613-1 TaxID=1336337 RepID=A0A3N4JJX0_9PEZI|nr:F-actin-capping protein subunit alpha [Choiromyces venosus 120613-1]
MSVSETIETASSFILDAPPGELQDVITDVKTLVNDDPAVIEGVTPAIEKYNKEQLITTKLPGASEQVIISEYNCLPGGRFFDVGSQSSFEFHHVKQKASNPQSWALESGNAELIKALLRDVAPHVKEHYPSSPAFGVYPVQDDAAVAVAIIGNKYSPSNYWNGRWRSTYTYTPSSSELTGTIQVDVHYYEDGNVRLLTTKPVQVSLNSGTSAEIVKTIASHEKKYQEELNRAFGALSEGAFKNLRRQLPISRQKIDWEKIGNYRLGQEIGGGRSVTR